MNKTIYPDFQSAVTAEVNNNAEVAGREFLLGDERKPDGKYCIFLRFKYRSDKYGWRVAKIMSDSRVYPLLKAAKTPGLKLKEEPTKTQITLRIPDSYKDFSVSAKQNGEYKIEVYIYFVKPKGR